MYNVQHCTIVLYCLYFRLSILFISYFTGISCPRGPRQAGAKGDPFAEEALQFTKEKCFQREVFEYFYFMISLLEVFFLFFKVLFVV